jgi:hypothetical protein
MGTMKTIWKYEIDITDAQVIDTKEDAEFLTAQLQGYYPCVWVVVDTEKENKKYVLEVFGTGNPIPDYDRDYIGTIQERSFVWHVFVRDYE